MPFLMPMTSQLRKRLQQLAPWATAMVFIVLTGWQLIPLFSDESPTVKAATNTGTANPDTQLQTILSSEIFGVRIDSDETEDSTTATSGEPQTTSLPYALKGIITGITPQTGSAIIELSPGDSRYFSAGREINSNITLDSVHSDHVIISNHGRQEILRLAELSLSMTQTPSTSNIGSQPAVAPPSMPYRDDSINRDNDSTLDPEDQPNRDLIRQRLEELRARNPS
jgi:type II secretory pathway component PulC